MSPARWVFVIAMLGILAILAFGLVAGAVVVFRAVVLSDPEVMADSTAAPGEVRTIDLGGGVSLEVVWVSPGEFLMGSPSFFDVTPYGAEAKAMDSELPQHLVKVSRGFWMGRYELTNAQFRRFRPAHSSGKYRVYSLDGDSQPVVNVTWHDAVAFCRWLSTETGLAFRLPSEAEWEYACRAGGSTAFSQGDSLDALDGFANSMNPSVAAQFNFSWAAFPWEDGGIVTSAAGQCKPNAWGLYDMHGNVWEWCHDWYGSDYYARGAATDPQGPSAGSKHVLRGGSWSDSPWYTRSAFRIARLPDSARVYDGFRVAMAPSSMELAAQGN